MSKLNEVTVKNVKNLRDIIISQASMISTLYEELEIVEKSSAKYRDWWMEERTQHEATKKELSEQGDQIKKELDDLIDTYVPDDIIDTDTELENLKQKMINDKTLIRL